VSPFSLSSPGLFPGFLPPRSLRPPFTFAPFMPSQISSSLSLPSTSHLLFLEVRCFSFFEFLFNTPSPFDQFFCPNPRKYLFSPSKLPSETRTSTVSLFHDIPSMRTTVVPSCFPPPFCGCFPFQGASRYSMMTSFRELIFLYFSSFSVDASTLFSPLVFSASFETPWGHTTLLFKTGFFTFFLHPQVLFPSLPFLFSFLSPL